jgi:hypothetical protein
MAMHGWTAVLVGLSGWSVVSMLLAVPVGRFLGRADRLAPALTPARVAIGRG